ncbi:hypothetical protein GC098_16420 [Paenibacillus sp. LMG 31458]|uniref:Uncharacterized protein n=1 Tax=Paenibacillus phytorum TaxID=2654977 RepID=A0ABX1XWT6_9BACL|nr:hypothetical protein [Paenibacillus phytorum]NOU72986.1 hypothetical protein [Paenibacillus phytorum]
MEKIAGIIVIFIVFMIPMYGVLIWTYFCPEDSLLWGKPYLFDLVKKASDSYTTQMKGRHWLHSSK